MKRSPFVILLALLVFSFSLPPNSHARWNDLSNIVSPNWFAELNSYPVEIVVQLKDGANEKTFKAWLNGKNITDKFVYNDTENKLTATIGPDDGLKIMERRERRWWLKTNILRTRVRGPKWKRDIDFRTFYVKVDAMKTIGPAGGVLKVNNPKSPIYGTELSFPAGCLDQKTMFSIGYDALHDNPDLATPPVIVDHPDVQFNKPVGVTMQLKEAPTEDTIFFVMFFDYEVNAYVPEKQEVKVKAGENVANFQVQHLSSISIEDANILFYTINESLCNYIGMSWYAYFPGPNSILEGALTEKTYDLIIQKHTVGGTDINDGCFGRCGLGCPGDDAFAEILKCGDMQRYTQACFNHDACCKYYADLRVIDNCAAHIECDYIFFACADDCKKADVCTEAFDYCGDNIDNNHNNEINEGCDSSVAPLSNWPYIRRDLAGTSNQPYGSKIATSLNLTEQFNIPGIPAGTILTGDVDNDGKLEIVHVAGDLLRIFDENGELKIPPVTLGFSSCHLSMLADVNGDGVLDIGIGTGEASSLKAYFYDGNGNLLHTLSRSAGYDSYMFPYAILKNGKCLVTLNAGYSHDNKNRGWAVYDLNTQDEIWNFKIGPFAWLASVADINNDGKYEITSASGTPHNGCCADGYNHNGTTTCDGDLWLIVVDEDGNQEIAKIYPGDGVVGHIFVDLNNDEEMEILGFEGHGPVYYHGDNQIHLFDRYGNTLYTFDGPYDGGAWTYAIADIDSNGKSEVVTSAGYGGNNKTFVLNDKLEKIDEIQGEGFVQLIADLNGDFVNDIVLISENGTVKVLDNELQMIDSYYIGGEFGFAAHSTPYIIASDIDDDGILELICRNDDGIHVLEFAQ